MKIKQTLVIALLAGATSINPVLFAQPAPASAEASAVQATVDALVEKALADPELDLNDAEAVQAAIGRGLWQCRCADCRRYTGDRRERDDRFYRAS
jgi:hypothetical protein